MNSVKQLRQIGLTHQVPASSQSSKPGGCGCSSNSVQRSLVTEFLRATSETWLDGASGTATFVGPAVGGALIPSRASIKAGPALVLQTSASKRAFVLFPEDGRGLLLENGTDTDSDCVNVICCVTTSNGGCSCYTVTVCGGASISCKKSCPAGIPIRGGIGGVPPGADELPPSPMGPDPFPPELTAGLRFGDSFDF